MPNERFLAALSRIETAAQRLEALAARPALPSAPVADPGLAERHERLRAGAAEAMARLDALIASQETLGQEGAA